MRRVVEELLAAAVFVPGQQHVGIHAEARARSPTAPAPGSCRTNRPARRDRRRACPCDTASSRSKAFTTEPAGSTSILSAPPVMSLTFFAKSRANSWKMSFAGQVLCQRMVIGPWRASDIRRRDGCCSARGGHFQKAAAGGGRVFLGCRHGFSPF